MEENKIQGDRIKKVESLLYSLNIYDDVVNNKCHCLFCNSIITIDNIDSILPNKDGFSFTCNRVECHSKLVGEG